MTIVYHCVVKVGEDGEGHKVAIGEIVTQAVIDDGDSEDQEPVNVMLQYSLVYNSMMETMEQDDDVEGSGDEEEDEEDEDEDDEDSEMDSEEEMESEEEEEEYDSENDDPGIADTSDFKSTSRIRSLLTKAASNVSESQSNLATLNMLKQKLGSRISLGLKQSVENLSSL